MFSVKNNLQPDPEPDQIMDVKRKLIIQELEPDKFAGLNYSYCYTITVFLYRILIKLVF